MAAILTEFVSGTLGIVNMSMRSSHLFGDSRLYRFDRPFMIVVDVVNYFAAARITLVGKEAGITAECHRRGDSWDLVIYDHLVCCLSFHFFNV